MIKAILITVENQSSLASNYSTVEEVEEQLPVGYYLVADFGNEDTFDVVSADEFANLFTVTGPINNGYVDVVFK